MIVLPDENNVAKYQMSGNITVESLKEFAQKFKEGTLSPVYKSQNIDSEQDPDTNTTIEAEDPFVMVLVVLSCEVTKVLRT